MSRATKTEQTRKRILEAAGQLFVAEGYDAVSVRKIAQKIGMSHGTIYIHFRDKDDLLYQVSEEHFSRLLSRLRRLPRSRDVEWRLRDALLEVIRFGLEFPHEYQLMMALQTTFGGPKTPNQWGPNSEQVGNYFDALLVEARDKDAIANADAQLDSLLLLATIHGTVLTAASEELDVDTASRLAELIVDTLIAGLGARHSGTDGGA